MLETFATESKLTRFLKRKGGEMVGFFFFFLILVSLLLETNKGYKAKLNTSFFLKLT